uniref:Putative tick metalloprotease 1 n=1 Tax=Amblyomma cajennense TaxID=34607 RepID=A0A023FUS8_AMBCJ
MIALTFILGVSAQLVFRTLAAPATKVLSERIVYPLHLESRADTGERVVRITDDLVLNLEKTSLFGDEVTVIGFDDDNKEVAMSMPGVDAEKDLYHDAKRLAAVHLTHDDGFQVEGVLGPRFRIRPLPAAERSSEGHVAHLLFEIEEKRENDPFHRIRRNDLRGRSLNTNESTFEEKSLIPEERTITAIYPELTVFTDSVFSKQFNYNYTAILRYVTVLVTCVNLRFTSVRDPYVWARPVYIVALNENNEIYMALSGSRHVYDATTLDNMPKMLKDYYYFKVTDISVTITARDIISTYNGDSSTAGYAYAGTACLDLKVAITEETPFTYDGIGLFAHELAHVLGAQHDGDPPISNIQGHPGAYSCSWNDGYLMSYIDKDENHHRFSYCSQLQIRYTARYTGRKCLLEINVKEEEFMIYKLPSEMITLDAFCRNVRRYDKGELKYNPDRGQKECKVYCNELRSTMMWIFSRPDGFSCSQDRVCYLGRCTQRPDVKQIYEDAQRHRRY